MSVKCRILKGGYCEITQCYGGSNNHLGTDIVGKGYTLDTVLAHSDGTVCLVQTGHRNNQGSTGMASYGNMVKIDHGRGCFTLYAHLDTVNVKNGQKVAKGQILGYMGNTGNSYGGHTHFEVFINNNRVDSGPYLDKDLYTTVTMPKPVTKNNKVEQVEVLCNDTLRVRSAHAINDNNIIGLAVKGFYNIVSTFKDKSYTWYEIEKGKWVASVSGCLTYHSIKKEEPKQDNKDIMISELKNQISTLEKEKQKLSDKNKLLEEENKSLREQDNEFITFVTPKNGLYGIHLKQDEILKYEKR